MYVQKQIPQDRYKADDSFVGKYKRLIREVVIPYQYNVITDNQEGVDKTHVIDNFKNAAKVIRGEEPDAPHFGQGFQDSDAGKWIEAAAYTLADAPDPELEKKIDEIVDVIAEAQDEDGYLDTWFTISRRECRWVDLRGAHELYTMGHLMEGAVAYYQATGKRKFLDVMLKNVEHIYDVFITNSHEGYPGHPEVELALLKMYFASGNEHCLELASHFINVRGVDSEYFNREWKKMNPNAPYVTDLYYHQCYAPVREQKDAVGHAVRAVYLYTAMANLASESGDETLLAACRNLWDSITKRRMYITGGIGSNYMWERFSADYDLPPDSAYAETCASVGLMFFASRMLENEVKGEYADIMEKAFYNTVLSGISIDGTHYSYVNPLECIPGISGYVYSSKCHVSTTRPGWHPCACCPPNLARVVASFGMYAYGESDNTAYCHLYSGGEVSFKNGLRLECKTEYPYGFDVNYRVIEGCGTLAIRIPGWSCEYSAYKNGVAVSDRTVDGYLYLEVSAGDAVSIKLDDRPYYMYASEKVYSISSCAAIMRGPLVYCFEGVDNGGDVFSIRLKRDEKLELSIENDAVLGEVAKISVMALRAGETEGLYTDKRPPETPCKAVAIPYYLWANRGENQMRVWMRYV